MELADVSAMVEKIRNHRFDGYTDTGVATEIEKFRSGDGIGSIGAAVDALKNVAVALADTDDTLRRELGKLGVEWQSQAGGQAAQVFTDQAGFSQDAMAKVDHSAEMIFAQGEAFNRTLYKLPDAATVRKGAGGFTVGDAALSLIGFETDHARDVVAAQNARAQAVEALNAYATASGDNLSSIESMAQPQNLLLNESAQDPSAIDLAGSAVDVGPGPDKGETGGDTRAAKSDSVVKDAGPVSNPTPKPHVSTPHHTAAPVVNVQAPRPSAPPPAAPEPGTTAPSGSTPPSAPPRPPGSGGGSPVIPPSHGPGQQPTPGGRPGEPLPPEVPCPPERSVNNVLGGPSSGSGPSGAEGGKGSGGGKPGGFGGPGGSAAEGGSGRSGGFAGGSAGGGGSEQSLAKGKLMGSGPQAPTVPGEVGRPFPAIPKSAGLGAGELGAGAVAAGAGGVGGATSGETERQGRGFGRGMVANSGKPVRQLPMGELPEEEAAALRNSEKLSPRKETGKPSMLETAAPQGTRGDEDAEHVRRFGIDDKDLFADQRMVSPDLIGDNGAEETR